jgi:hypothetical protein
VPPGCGNLSEGLIPATRHTREDHLSGSTGWASLAASAMGTGRRPNHHSWTSPRIAGIRESDLTIPVVTEDRFHVRTIHLAIHRSRLQTVPGQQPPRFAGAPLSHRPRADGASIWARRPVPIVYRSGSADPARLDAVQTPPVFTLTKPVSAADLQSIIGQAVVTWPDKPPVQRPSSLSLTMIHISSPSAGLMTPVLWMCSNTYEEAE